ncbi:unnamed protein product, partial [Sphacelaria rigidula]
MALPQTIAGLSVTRAPLILPSPTSAAESTAEGSETRNQRYKQDAGAVQAAAAAAAAAACEAPTQAGIRTLRGSVVGPAASTEKEGAADGDAPDVSQPSVQSMIHPTRGMPFAMAGQPSGAAAAAGPSGVPVSAENHVNVAGGDTEDQAEVLPERECVIPAVTSQSRGTGGGPALANAEVVLVGDVTGSDEPRADESGEDGDRAAVRAQREQRSVRGCSEYGEVVDCVGTERPVVRRGQRWRTRIFGALMVVALAVGGRVLSGGGSSSTYRGKLLWQ